MITENVRAANGRIAVRRGTGGGGENTHRLKRLNEAIAAGMQHRRGELHSGSRRQRAPLSAARYALAPDRQPAKKQGEKSRQAVRHDRDGGFDALWPQAIDKESKPPLVKPCPSLIEINSGREPQKSGVMAGRCSKHLVSGHSPAG